MTPSVNALASRALRLSDACIQRGLYQRAYVDKLLAEPEAHFTRIQGRKLWHLALLEWWLQVHVDGEHDCRSLL